MKTIIHFVKFGDIDPSGSAYETWAATEDWVQHIEDASNAQPYVFSDQRWFPRRMAIGEAHAFITPVHTATFYDRATRRISRVESGWVRKMWLQAVYDQFFCGPDLGVRPVLILSYDPTAGVHTKDRFVELYYVCAGGGLFMWQAHRSDLVYAHGAAQFGEHTLALNESGQPSQSSFYLLGGPATQPKLTGCAPPLKQYPPRTQEDTVIKPEVTVDLCKLTPAANLPDGDLLIFHDRMNAIGTSVRIFVQDGSAYMSISYAGGLEGHTGARRPVR